MTHACDEEKIARIQEMDIGAIEIDLSAYRDRRLNEISEQILYDAPRIWLHNPRERQAREKLEDRTRQRAEEKRKQVSRLSGLYRHRSPTKNERQRYLRNCRRQRRPCRYHKSPD